jgi:hypothetical protein
LLLLAIQPSKTRASSRRNLLVDPDTLFDFGYTREKVVNFFCKPGITGALLFVAAFPTAGS